MIFWKKKKNFPVPPSSLEPLSLESLAGNNYQRQASERVVLQSGVSSEFGKKVETLKHLYLNFCAYSREESITAKYSAEKGVELDRRVTSYYALLEEGRANPLDKSQILSVDNKINHFAQLVSWRYSLLEKEFSTLSQRLVGLEQEKHRKYIEEQVPLLDALAEQSYCWQRHSWLGGRVALHQNDLVTGYVSLLGALQKAEPFWKDFQEKYVAQIFEDQKEAEKERAYARQKFQDYFLPYLNQEKLLAWRVGESTAGKIPKDLVELQRRFSQHNSLKHFAVAKRKLLLETELEFSSQRSLPDLLVELRNSYHSSSGWLPGQQEPLLYNQDAVLAYEKARKELLERIEEKLKKSSERDVNMPKSEIFSRAGDLKLVDLNLQPHYFDISSYLQNYNPRSRVLKEIQDCLGSSSLLQWRKKVPQVRKLLTQPLDLRSTYDSGYLAEAIYALETSFQRGILFDLTDQDNQFKTELKNLIQDLHSYTSHYNVAAA